jgi:hypothetical protein
MPFPLFDPSGHSSENIVTIAAGEEFTLGNRTSDEMYVCSDGNISAAFFYYEPGELRKCAVCMVFFLFAARRESGGLLRLLHKIGENADAEVIISQPDSGAMVQFCLRNGFQIVGSKEGDTILAQHIRPKRPKLGQIGLIKLDPSEDNPPSFHNILYMQYIFGLLSQEIFKGDTIHFNFSRTPKADLVTRTFLLPSCIEALQSGFDWRRTHKHQLLEFLEPIARDVAEKIQKDGMLELFLRGAQLGIIKAPVSLIAEGIREAAIIL